MAIQRLTAEQSAFAERNFFMVGDFLKKNNRAQSEGWYDAALTGYLEAVRTFRQDASLALDASAFEKYAEKEMAASICERVSQEAEALSITRVCIDDEMSGADVEVMGMNDNAHFQYHLSVYEVIDALDPEVPDTVWERHLVSSIMAQLTDKQKQALCLVSNGYHPDEIARMCGIRSKSVSARIGRARKVAKQVLVNIG